VFLIGGETNSSESTVSRNKVYILNEHDFSLKEIQPMFQARSSFGICYCQDYIYVAGGLFS